MGSLVRIITFTCSIIVFASFFMTTRGESAYPQLVNQEPSFPHDFVVLETIEQVAFSKDWRFKTQRTVPSGAHVMVIVGVGGKRACEPINVPISDATVFVILPTQISSPSSTATKPGTYYDILVPWNQTTCRLSAFRLIEWKPTRTGPVSLFTGNKEVRIDVLLRGHFTSASKSFHVGLSNSFLIKGHCKTYCPREAELGHKYKKLLQDHHITPIQSWVRVPPIIRGYLNLNDGRENGLSFWQLANDANQHFINFPRQTLYQNSQAYLQALERTVQKQNLIGRAWVYVRDEPQDFEALKKELLQYRKFAPSVLTMVTVPYGPDLKKLIDIFAPNIAEWDRTESGYDGKLVWPYASCMGSCGPNRAYKNDMKRAPGPDVGRPDFLIDRPASRIQDYFNDLYRSNANSGLYYHGVEGHALYRKGIDILRDPWNFGGNGDGALLYPGRPNEFGLVEHSPLPSFRLKLIRQAQELL